MRNRRILGSVTIFVALATFARPAFPQALPNLNSLRVSYTTVKTSTKPEGELKAQIDQIDKDLAAATREGRAGEQRRLFAKGLALLAGPPGTAAPGFEAALLCRTHAV